MEAVFGANLGAALEAAVAEHAEETSVVAEEAAAPVVKKKKGKGKKPAAVAEPMAAPQGEVAQPVVQHRQMHQQRHFQPYQPRPRGQYQLCALMFDGVKPDDVGVNGSAPHTGTLLLGPDSLRAGIGTPAPEFWDRGRVLKFQVIPGNVRGKMPPRIVPDNSIALVCPECGFRTLKPADMLSAMQADALWCGRCSVKQGREVFLQKQETRLKMADIFGSPDNPEFRALLGPWVEEPVQMSLPRLWVVYSQGAAQLPAWEPSDEPAAALVAKVGKTGGLVRPFGMARNIAGPAKGLVISCKPGWVTGWTEYRELLSSGEGWTRCFLPRSK